MNYIFLFICIVLDYFYPLFIPSYFHHLSFFYPMFTLTYLVFLYKKVENKEIFKITLLAGILYDLCFSYLFLFHTLLFFAFLKIMKKIDKYIRYNSIIRIITLLFFLFLYDAILFVLVYASGYSMVNLSDLFYKFSHSILLNIAFYIWLGILFSNIKRKNRLKYKN